MRKSAARKKSSAPKSRSDPPLKGTQLKSIHYLISKSCFISILESSQENIHNIRAMCEKYCHGDGSDIAGKANDFLNGKFRFRVMWEDYNGAMTSVISNGNGHLSGASRGSIKQVMCHSTLSDSQVLDDRTIM